MFTASHCISVDRDNNYYYYYYFTALCAGLPSEQVPEETFTHSYLSWSSAILYQLLYALCTVYLHNLSPGPRWSEEFQTQR